MILHTPSQFLSIIATSLIMLGVVSIVSGIYLLITRASGKAIQSIAAQTTRLAQKGLAEEISGLVGNASALLDSLNELVRTSAGIGIFLVLFGFIQLIAAFIMITSF